MSVTVTLPAGIEYVGAAFASSAFLLGGLMVTVNIKRRKAGIPYPQMYATAEEAKASKDAHIFNCAQRAHQNTLEMMPIATFATLVTATRYPHYAASALGIWVVSRIFYARGYLSGDPKKRVSIFYRMGSLSMVGSLLASAYLSVGWVYNAPLIYTWPSKFALNLRVMSLRSAGSTCSSIQIEYKATELFIAVFQTPLAITMTSIIQTLLSKIFPTDATRVTMLGLGASGKTTILYLLKTHSIVTTIPSMGFNIETVNVVSSGGKHIDATVWDIGTGCGMQYMFGLLNSYVSHSDALIWVVDASERGEWLQESVDSLARVILDLGSPGDDGKTIAPIPIMILANKSDRANAMSIDEVRKHFAKATKGRFVGVFKTTCTPSTGLENSGLPEAFDWLNIALDISRHGKTASADITDATPKQVPSINLRETSTLASKLASWIMRAQEDNAPEEFLAQFDTFSLPSWDHYTHIRVAYVLLTKYGRQDGKNKIFQGLEKYISSSAQTKGRSFHVTMTYFWIQIVHFGIRNTPPSLEADEKMKPVLDSLSPHDFAKFLLINPHVADGNLWADYYTKDTIMSPKAKQEMMLPDIKPLPNLVVRDAIRSLGTK
ncbi:hypothetical protein D9619_011526 [Psilocybe cf. subviscida]|uniref:Uncharacterized protein n=1 Tax=Psilocybe cf. subviscida TaxID=2480587 RepID=A0A8H5BT34_9AGAR|nr:hypothetical protein D9619_011526 [Psilocybe cf. subviscida]